MGKVLAIAALAVVLIGCGSDPSAAVERSIPAAVTPTPTAAIATPTVSPGDVSGSGSPSGGLALVPDIPPDEIEVRFSTRAQVFRRTVLIDVAADLPNGAVIRYEVGEGEDGTGPHQASGLLDIFNKHAAVDVDVSDWDGPLARVYVAFRPWGEEQARMISQYFGEDGHRLSGANISVDGPRKLVEYDTVLRFPTTQVYRGRGNDVVGPFSLHSGLVTLFAQHSGPSDLEVQITSLETDTVASLNGTGKYEGERAYTIGAGDSDVLEPGEYQMEITAEGTWLLELIQEFPTGGFTFPLSAEDVGDQVIRWLKIKEGDYLLRADHAGSGHFVIALLPVGEGPDGQYIDATGNFVGESSIKITSAPGQGIPPGIYALAVQADGHWHLSVE